MNYIFLAILIAIVFAMTANPLDTSMDNRIVKYTSTFILICLISMCLIFVSNMIAVLLCM